MKTIYLYAVLIGLLAGVGFGDRNKEAFASHMGAVGEKQQQRKRPLFVYPGNYREEVNRLKEKFRSAFGYDLMDLDEGWRPEEIQRFHAAFSRLPDNFYRIEGLKGFYRAARLQVKGGGQNAQSANSSGIPAATFPRLTTVYRQAHQSYQVVLADEPLRIELYNDLFYESEEDFNNIVHHEMGHVFDLNHGLLSFSHKWIKLSHFRVLHLPALDGKADSDFLYTLISDPSVFNYGPVSSRHLPTYSRENLQEDFANSIAAYIHYPYFQYTHPHRYQYLKENVFLGREYFKREEGGYADVFLNHFKKALSQKDWPKIIFLGQEQSRFLKLALEERMIGLLQDAVNQKISAEADVQLAITSCYLIHPKALKLRRDLLVARRISPGKVLRNSRCRRMGRQAFEAGQAQWPLSNIQFYREEKNGKIQFLDPAALTAYARGLSTRYQWRLSVTSPRNKVFLKGESEGPAEPNGAFKLDLEQTAKGRYRLPENRELILEVRALRFHPQKPKPLESPWTPIRFVVQPGFEYMGPAQVSFQFIYPASWQSGQ